MDNIKTNLMKNTTYKVVIIASAVLIFIGMMTTFFQISEMDWLGDFTSASIKDMPFIIPLVVGVLAALMIVATLMDRMVLALIGSAGVLVVDIILAILSKASVKFVLLVLYGDELKTAGNIANSFGDLFGFDTDELIEELAEYISVSFKIGFFLILIGALAGVVFSVLDLAKSGDEVGLKIAEVVEPVVKITDNKQGLLRCVRGEAAGSSIIMNSGDSIVLGRDPKISNIILREDKNISRRHCTITYRNGQFYIIDHSSNGTRLGSGIKLEKDREVPIGDQATFLLSANTEFTVQIKPN